MNKLLLKVFILCLLTHTNAFAESMKIETIQINHRSLDEVISVVKPLVAEGGTVTGMNNQLIVKTTPSNLKQIKQVLNQIDYKPRKLMISVKQDIDGNFQNRVDSLSGRYDSENLDITVPDKGRKGSTVEGKDSDGNVIRYRVIDTRSRIEDRNTFRVQTVEGNPAYISTGQSVPVASTAPFLTIDGIFLQGGIEYRDVMSGFYVLPRLQGDNVTLMVSPFLERTQPYQNDTFDIQSMETVATGRLGEWLQIGGAAQSYADDAGENTISTRRRGQELRTILIKVEEIQ